jgi:hypothetical protein
MSALQTIALFGACLKRLTAVIGAGTFLILYVIISESELMFDRHTVISAWSSQIIQIIQIASNVRLCI